jgi:LmbE family N-acetylglucosaminyl deacetylase
MKTLLVILAHPDDESFGPGGTLAKYSQEGNAVHYLCGTRGESGTVGATQLNGFADVAALRTSELNCAAQALGLAGVHFLGYRDSGMAGSADNAHADSLHAAPLDEVAQRIIGFIDQLKPHSILTHDQFGGYGHPDHIKLHLATVRAYEIKYGIKLDYRANGLMKLAENWPTTARAHARVPRLYFPVFPKGLVKLGVRIMPLLRQDPRKFGRNKDIDLVKIASWDVPVTTQVNTKDFVDAKARASACHASQQAPPQQGFIIRFFFRRSAGKEFFARAYPPVGASERQETDLIIDEP